MMLQAFKVLEGLPGGPSVKNLPSNLGDMGSIPGRKLDPTCYKGSKTRCSQMNEYIKRNFF